MKRILFTVLIILLSTWLASLCFSQGRQTGTISGIVIDTEGNILHKTKSENLSDGGVFLTIPINALPNFGAELNVCFSVPRSTPNTYMFEEVSCKAKVVRHQPLVDRDLAGMGLQFTSNQNLMLEV